VQSRLLTAAPAIKDTNVEARRAIPAKFCSPLGFNNILECLYRGHSDMPAKVRAASSSVDAGPVLLQFQKEIGKREEDWALTDTTATRLINAGHIQLIFSW
jgi:hypothetical protein